ncbi:hypothetical protein NC796_03905 [Aliifodinibius sp. S!AR15-10]|uniref:hypothetical protein n=1 Tax=Aliifodinibius sp. S!AR15-10 TaxID=2950437 RepID=UPI0028562730|nr:hypothetical protein [Aliifodinibius sp. S!AR15-10]MDR8390271.1 hypothetical protein [Aliifodinibius sp. S!AR15-10]
MSENGQGQSNEQKKEPEPLIVITTVASFADKKRGINHRLQPIRILRKNGQRHRVREVRKWHDEPVGHGHKHVHVTLVTEDDRYLDIVFDTRKIGWFLVYEESGMVLD